MNRPVFLCALLSIAAAALTAQEASQSSPYQGTSNPPPDDAIVTADMPQAKPPAGKPAAAADSKARPTQQAQPKEDKQAQPAVAASAANEADPDGGIVQVVEQPGAASEPSQPVLSTRSAAADPDGGIVHPQPLRPGELGDGTMIRVELIGRLSTATSEKGEAFRSRVASDVLQGGQMLIPAGAEIDGRVAEISSGHFGGHGSMYLVPETVILPNGSHYMLRADLTGTPGSRTRLSNEGSILPASRVKRDGIEYGGVVGGGAMTGAILAGPVGALTGSLIGAGVVTAHLLVSHPQAALESGTVLLFTLSEPLLMAPEAERAN